MRQAAAARGGGALCGERVGRGDRPGQGGQRERLHAHRGRAHGRPGRALGALRGARHPLRAHRGGAPAEMLGLLVPSWRFGVSNAGLAMAVHASVGKRGVAAPWGRQVAITTASSVPVLLRAGAGSRHSVSPFLWCDR